MDDEDRQSILSRRARFIAAALATLTASATACDGCSDVVVVDDGQGGEGGQPQPCLSPKPPEGGGGEGGTGGSPQPCLSQPLGGGGEGGVGEGGFIGQGGAQPCLAPAR